MSQPLGMPACHTDETVVALDANQRLLVARNLGELTHGAAFLGECAAHDTLTVSIRYNVLASMRAYLEQLGLHLGHAADLALEREHTQERLRTANDEIRQLRERLGTAEPLAGLGEALYRLDRCFTDYWKSLGFSLADGAFQARFSGHAAYHTKVSFFLNDAPSTMSQQPLTDQAVLDAGLRDLEHDGVTLYRDPHDHQRPRFLDTDGNRAWVLRTLRVRFPSARVLGWKSMAFDSVHDHAMLRHAKIHIELADLVAALEPTVPPAALPARPPADPPRTAKPPRTKPRGRRRR